MNPLATYITFGYMEFLTLVINLYFLCSWIGCSSAAAFNSFHFIFDFPNQFPWFSGMEFGQGNLGSMTQTIGV